MINLFSLKGKKALITGGTGGIGKAISEALHEAGAEIVMVGYSSNISKIFNGINTNGSGIYGIKGDLGNREELKDLFRQALDKIGTIDILINCAGIQKRCKAEDFSLKDWDRIIEINLTVAFELSQLAGKIMIKKRYGKIINIASMNSFGAIANIPAYVASKGGIAQLTKALAVEWAKFGINVNAIAPGYIRTKLTRELWGKKVTEEKIFSRIPAGRWGKPEDLKGAIIFLASEASSYLHGVVLPVDGGFLIG